MSATVWRSTAMTSRWSAMKPSSASKLVYWARWRAVSCFSAEHWTDLVDPFEHADQDLCEQLRGLSQEGLRDRDPDRGSPR
jgi:hypothetical protein